MDQPTDVKKSKRIRVSWKNLNVVRTFLEACIQEITLSGREGGSLKAASWKKVADILLANHNFSVDRKQMKNHYDYLKRKYGAWLLLSNKTGNVYDPSTNTFNLTDEEWEIASKKNKYVEALKKTTLPFPDLCSKLFDGSMATGIKSWGPTSKEPMHCDESRVFADVEESEIHDIPQTISSSSKSSCNSQIENKKKKGKQSMSVVGRAF